MSSSLVERLHRLAAVWGPSGREHKIAEVLQEAILPFVTEVKTDRFGNLLATRAGKAGGKRVMLSAHMDTKGAIASEVTEQGLIRMGPVGRVAAHHLIGQRVVWGSGVVGVIQHEPDEDAKEIDFKRIWCEIGATSRTEALANVRLGDMCVPVGDLQQMGDRLAGPNLGNRTGCALLLEVAEHLADTPHELVFAFTCQGEVGQRGAGPAAFTVEPDLAFALDLTKAGDLPGARGGLKLGAGPVLKLKDGTYMAHHGLSELVRQTAEANKIPLQTGIDIDSRGQTDAQAIRTAGRGVATVAIDLPARYLGTANEMVSIPDLHGTADLLLKLLQGPLDA